MGDSSNFVPVSHQSDFRRIREVLGSGESSIVAHKPKEKGTLFVAKGLRWSNEGLIAEIPDAEERQLEDFYKDLIVSFKVNDIQYFTRSDVSRRYDGKYTIPMGKKIFHLQRRRHFRANVPSMMPAFFEFTNPSDGSVVTCPLVDVSQGGCAFEILNEISEYVKQEGYVAGRITMSEFAPVPITGEVRRVGRRPDRSGSVASVQFEELSKPVMADLITIVMSIYREEFDRYEKK